MERADEEGAMWTRSWFGKRLSGIPGGQISRIFARLGTRVVTCTGHRSRGRVMPDVCSKPTTTDGLLSIYTYRRFRARMKGRVSGPTLYRGFQSQCRCLLQTYEASTISHSDLKSQDGNQSIPRLVVFMPSSLFLLFLLSPSSVSS
jgi:hypothetical protein